MLPPRHVPAASQLVGRLRSCEPEQVRSPLHWLQAESRLGKLAWAARLLQAGTIVPGAESMEFGSGAPSQALLQAPRCRVQELQHPSRRALNWRPRLQAMRMEHSLRTEESPPAGVPSLAKGQPGLPALRPKSA